MSDILIKGFDFPEDCSKCPLRKVPQMRDDICVISGCRVHNYPERPSWCYLHEIKPHGRLIDADLWLSTHWVSQQVIDAIKNAPTVLEASDNSCPSDDDDHSYEMQSDMRDYCERYEPSYNPEDGSM